MTRYALALLIVVTSFVAKLDKALAQSLEAIEAAEETVIEVWERSPIAFRTAVLVESSPDGFGIYNERADDEFAAGEPIVAYAEPVGYAWRGNEDGTYTFGFDVDLLVKKPDGTIVAGQQNFQHLELTSRARNREFTLTLTLTLDGAPPGDYVVEYITRDIASDKFGVISLPFSIVE